MMNGQHNEYVLLQVGWLFNYSYSLVGVQKAEVALAFGMMCMLWHLYLGDMHHATWRAGVSA